MANELELPQELRGPLRAYVDQLRAYYESRDWGIKIGFGRRPAVLVIDLARAWTDSNQHLGSDLDTVVTSTRSILDAARGAGVPVVFTAMAYAPDDPVSPFDLKMPGSRAALRRGDPATELDPRLGVQPDEVVVWKKYASAFRGTNLRELLSNWGVDTLIVTGCSTMHCVHLTCADALPDMRVVVAEEAVGDRSELFHLVGLLDIRLAQADVVPVEDVVNYLSQTQSVE
jgi:nicotinamidase-related amidase